MIVAWFNEWNLFINSDSSVQVIFTTRNNFLPIAVYINGKPVNIEKSPGIHLDSKLNYRQHLNAKFKQIHLWYINKFSLHEYMEIRSLPHTEENNTRRLRRFRTSDVPGRIN